MAHVEGIREGIEPQAGELFQVSLDDPRDFDPGRFDEFAVRVSKDPSSGVDLKYVVCGMTMVLFDKSLNHGVVFGELSLAGGESAGKLNSAGFVQVVIEEDGVYRFMSGYSETLEMNGLLSKRDSNVFRETVMKPILEAHFNVLE